MAPAPSLCRGDNFKLSAPNGTLASVTTADTGCGSSGTPWLIQGQPGQTVTFRVEDFALQNARNSSRRYRPGHSAPNCNVYAILKDLHAGKTARLCGGMGREKMVATTFSHEVEVRIVANTNREKRYFLLHYQGKGDFTGTRALTTQ